MNDAQPSTFPRFPRPGQYDSNKPLLARAKEITNWFDAELGSVVDMKRATVQAVLAGRTPEYLSAGQKAQLLMEVQAYVSCAQACLEEMELFA